MCPSAFAAIVRWFYYLGALLRLQIPAHTYVNVFFIVGLHGEARATARAEPTPQTSI
jgi:hypothetical protein